METKVRPSEMLQDVDEIAGWITVKRAAEIIGIEVPSVSAKVYAQKFHAVRIAGVILCEKKSVEKFAEERARIKAESELRKQENATNGSLGIQWNKLRKSFASLPPEDRERILAQLNGA